MITIIIQLIIIITHKHDVEKSKFPTKGSASRAALCDQAQDHRRGVNRRFLHNPVDYFQLPSTSFHFKKSVERQRINFQKKREPIRR